MRAVALKLVALDGNQDAADAAAAVRIAYLELMAALSASDNDWRKIAQAADNAYLATGVLSALAKAAHNH